MKPEELEKIFRANATIIAERFFLLSDGVVREKKHMNEPSFIETVQSIIAPLEQTIAEKDAEIEKLRMQVVACGTIVMMNTPESFESTRIPKDNPYWSVMYSDCERAVLREMALRAELETAIHAAGVECEAKHDALEELGRAKEEIARLTAEKERARSVIPKRMAAQKKLFRLAMNMPNSETRKATALARYEELIDTAKAMWLDFVFPIEEYESVPQSAESEKGDANNA